MRDVFWLNCTTVNYMLDVYEIQCANGFRCALFFLTLSDRRLILD